MSIECSECEHDLRGGHADDCSRKPPPCVCGHEQADHDYEDDTCEKCQCGQYVRESP